MNPLKALGLRRKGRPLRAGRANAQSRCALGRRMKAVREHIGMTQAQLATFLGWPVSDVIGVEMGTTGLSAGRQEDLARWINSMKVRRLLETPGPAALRPVILNDGIVPAGEERPN